jgi:hypothetical protein
MNGKETNLEKTTVMRLPKQPSPVHVVIVKKTTEECGIFQGLV